MANIKYNEEQKTNALAQFNELVKTMSKSKAARQIGISTPTFSYWMKKNKKERKRSAVTVQKVEELAVTPNKMFAFYGTKTEILDLVRSL